MAGSDISAGSQSLFEEDYLVRSLGRIACDNETALTELVANAWDAGAAVVDVTIPSTLTGILSIEDDGHGMTAAQFTGRWMKLGYNRIRHQTSDVEFPPERNGWRRKAFGRNGEGRHGLLCFSDEYSVETWRSGNGNIFQITTDSQEAAFKISAKTSFNKEGHGTKLSVIVNKHLPNPDKIREILAAKFIHDPQFTVRVNGQSVTLSEHSGLIEKSVILIDEYSPATVFVIDTTKTSKKTTYQGIAFWANGRLIGSPSWIIGKHSAIDGRLRIAKRYSLVVQLDEEWMFEIESDWSKFKTSQKTECLFEKVYQYAQGVLERLSDSLTEECTEEALIKNRETFRQLPKLVRADVASFARSVAKLNPSISTETLSSAVQVLINLEKSKSGADLLEKLTRLGEEDIEGLDRLLSQWTVRDALTVLDEIDQRIAILSAIEKLSGDESADELHTLHPLVTQARWLFGPEFESHEFTSNISLRNAAQKILKKQISTDKFINHKQRPDLVILKDSTYYCSRDGGF